MHLVGDVLLCATVSHIVAINVEKREPMWKQSFDVGVDFDSPSMIAATNEVLLPITLKNDRKTSSSQLGFFSYTPELFKSDC